MKGTQFNMIRSNMHREIKMDTKFGAQVEDICIHSKSDL
jgi:hypothetical protein